jgi:hypothetical protein
MVQDIALSKGLAVTRLRNTWEIGPQKRTQVTSEEIMRETVTLGSLSLAEFEERRCTQEQNTLGKTHTLQ